MRSSRRELDASPACISARRFHPVPLPKPARIACVISSLGAGGAERVMVNLCNHWAADAHVTLITLDGGQSDFYRTDARVVRRTLDVLYLARSPLAGLKALRHRTLELRRAFAASKPDVVVAFMDRVNILTILSAYGLGIPVLASERVYPPMQPLPLSWFLLRELAYRRAARLVIQSHDSVDWALRFRPRAAIAVLPNPVDPTFAAGLDTTAERSRTIVAMGRLTEQKGFDLLIEAFASVRAQLSGWRLVIHGEGPERDRLESLAVALSVSDIVDLPGNTNHPAEVLCDAGVFVLSSRFEGFPNVLLEAMWCGCAVIAADCLTGPRDIVVNGSSGLLVKSDSSTALADALVSLIEDSGARARLGLAAWEAARAFSADVVVQGWDSLLAAVVAENDQARRS